MIKEHVPNYQKLIEIPGVCLENLCKRVSEEDWKNDRECLHELITDITATLISYDTQTLTGREFKPCVKAIKTLFSDLEREGHIKILEVQCEAGRTALLITPPEDICDIQEAIRLYECNEFSSPISLNNTLLHAHIDTFTLPRDPKAVARLRTFFDRDNDLLYGRGANDMKGTIAVALLLFHLCVDSGITPPVLLLTSDEEIGGEYGGLNLMKVLRSNLLTIDMEPIAHNPGTYVDEILPGLVIGLMTPDEATPEKLNHLLSLLEKSYDKGACVPSVSVNSEYVNMSIATHKLQHSYDLEKPTKLRKELLSLAKMAGFTANEGDPYGYAPIPGFKSNISKPKRKILVEALKNHFPLEKSDLTTTHYSSSVEDPLVKLTRRAKFRGSILTLATKSRPNDDDIVIIGTDEAGGGRHTPVEAAKVHQFGSMLHTIFESHQNLHQMRQFSS